MHAIIVNMKRYMVEVHCRNSTTGFEMT